MQTKSFSLAVVFLIVLAIAGATSLSAQGVHYVSWGSPGDFHSGPREQCGDPRCNRNMRQEQEAKTRLTSQIHATPEVRQYPQFRSLKDVLMFLQGRTIAVLPVKPVEQGQGEYEDAILQQLRYAQYARSAMGAYGDPYALQGYGGCNGLLNGYGGGALFGGYDIPLYAGAHPSMTLGSVLTSELRKEMRFRGANTRDGDQAQYVIDAVYRVRADKARRRSFDGFSVGQIIRDVGQAMYDPTQIQPSKKAVFMESLGTHMSSLCIIRGSRHVEVTLDLEVKDASSDQIIYTMKGRGMLDTNEFVQDSVLGYSDVMINHPVAEELAVRMVRAALGLAEALPTPPPTAVERQREEIARLKEQRQLLIERHEAVELRREIGNLEAEVAALSVLVNSSPPAKVEEQNDH